MGAGDVRSVTWHFRGLLHSLPASWWNRETLEVQSEHVFCAGGDLNAMPWPFALCLRLEYIGDVSLRVVLLCRGKHFRNQLLCTTQKPLEGTCAQLWHRYCSEIEAGSMLYCETESLPVDHQ